MKVWAVGVVIAAAIAFWVGTLTGVSRDEVEGAIADNAVANCEGDRQFRRQYRRRGVAEEELLRLQGQSNEALIEVVNALSLEGPVLPELLHLGQVLDKVNSQLNDLRAEIKIIPLPDCESARELVD